MKKGNLEKWNNISDCTNLLLFSQLVNELLFDYSIPSNRVSTLNSHYLCYDALNTIDSIEFHGVPEGTLKPIMEELFSSLKKDPVFKNKKNSPLDFFVKYQKDKYVSCSRAGDMNYEELKKTANAIQTCFFNDNQYFNELKREIVDIIKTNANERQDELFRLVKSMLTELMNMGYTVRYIFDVMKQNYWNTQNDIKSADEIDNFFDAFSLSEKKYEVMFCVKKKRIEKLITSIPDVDFIDDHKARFQSHNEKLFCRKKNNESFISFKTEALDPFAASERIKNMLMIKTALYRLFDHTFRYDINSMSCGVYDENCFYKFYNPISAVEHTKTLSVKQINESMAVSNEALESIAKNRAYNDLVAIINAARMHAHSLDSSSEENQLLDLWAIFESVLDISNKHTSDRIDQVCMYLVPILKRNYIFSLFKQLANDIKNYNQDMYNDIVENCTDEIDVVQKICEFVLLPSSEKEVMREFFLGNCHDFPLLNERIRYYADALKDTKSVYDFVEKHAETVRWQVMRIYRNRNLIIHNGESMPYLSLLIENLHSYVDDFLSYAIHTLSKGHDVDSMCQELFVKECQWNAVFQKNNRQLDSDLIKEMLSI